ncbi:hypothetical protein ACFV3N_23170 [Streptomyces bauhiniae]|uniref:hypothetical protein n=1 Tax=Streptomyces bauhiniae TaxID=2340725 RepID=UPI00365A07CF
MFKADPFFPGVSHIEGQHDAWDRAGVAREPHFTGTNIRWTYEFLPRRGRGWVLRGPFKPLWQRYMRRALGLMAEAAEARR